MNKIRILNVEFDNINMNEAIDKCNKFLDKDKLSYIVTPNPEIVMEAKEDNQFNKILNEANLVIPDGIGIIIASKILKNPLKQRLPGFELICNLFENSEKEKKVYLLGSKPGVCELAKENIEKRYNLKVVGLHDGYFKEDDETSIVEDINNSGANILLVGMGMKKQEKFIYKYKDKLNVKIAIGCGGSIDVLSGTVKRAPKFFQKLGLEWLYRLIKQPTRLKRMLVLPEFLLIILFKEKRKTKNK